MVRTTNLVEHGHAVKDLIHCAQCGNPMELNGNTFSCPSNREGEPERCQTQPTDTETLLGKVMTCLIGRLMTDGVTQGLVDMTYRKITGDFTSISEQISDKQRTLRLLNNERSRPGTSSPERENKVKQLDSEIAALGTQLRSLRDQKRGEPFVKNEEKIRETARDPGTYLENAQPNETRELIGTFVEDIRVGSESVELVYLRGLPDGHGGTAITAEDIVLR